MQAKRFQRAAMVLALLTGVAALSLGLGSAAQTGQDSKSAAASKIKSLRCTDLGGKTFAYKDLTAHKATVFLFLSGLCPVCNTYAPRIVRLAQNYGKRDVAVIGIYADTLEDEAEVKQRAEERGYTFFPIVKDHDNVLTDLLGATMVPQAVIVDSSGAIRYRGRIDDNSVSTRVVRHDLTDALDALLAGKPILHTHTTAFGCTLRRDPAPAKHS